MSPFSILINLPAAESVAKHRGELRIELVSITLGSQNE